ncbi:MAG: DUF5678 domain-containing protein [Candidatus Methanofastidiosia archaeon]
MNEIVDEEYEWFCTHTEEFFKKYSSKYVVTENKKIVAILDDFSKLSEIVKKYKNPYLHYIPKESELELLIRFTSLKYS